MSNIPVHTGQWIDWSYGLVLGSYRTFTVRDTLYIIGATSAFLTLVGGGVWNIVAFIYHQTLAKKEPDIITLQHRSIYRNDSTATSAILDAFWVYWQWKPWRLCGRRRRVGTSGPLKHLWPPHRRPKKRAKHVGMRTCLLMLPALTIFSGFVVAGIFGSHIAAPAYKSNTMLVATRLDQGTCGITLFDDTIEAVTAFDIDVANRTRAAVSYARSCYSPPSGSVNAVSCSLFANSKLEYEADDTECPFEDSMCAINSSTPAHRLRTKPLDSHHDFGINAPAFQRLKLLKETICAPLIVHGFTSTSSANGAEGINNRSTMTNYNYGAVPNVGDATWQYNTASAYDNVPFEIFTYLHNSTGPAQWIPISSLSRTDADVTIIFIAPNSIKFRDPVYDPVFQATYGDTELSNTGERFTVYSPDYPVSVVGCTEQYAICNPNRKVNNCTSFDGQNALLSNIHSVGLSQDQYVTAVRMVYMIADGTTYSSVDGIGPDALQVWDEVHDFVAPGVPANQWQVEMQGWLETTLSKWQAYMVEYAHNTGSKGAHGHVGYPISNSSLQKIWENQCRNQKISNVGAYQNVSIFGFAFTWATGGMLILLSWVLKFFVKRYDKGSKRKNRPGTIERRVAWNIDGKFQQQRIALQSAGYCGLVGGEDDVPYLEEEAILPLPFHAKEARDDGSTGYVRRSSPSVEQQSINHPAEEAAQPRADDDDGAKIEELLHLTENPDGHAPESLLPPPRPTDIPNGHASEGAVLPPRLDDSSSSTDVNSASPEHVATEGEASLDGRLSSQEEGVHGPSISPATCNQNNGTDHPANDDDPAQVTLG